jgi:hypothetical protein
MAMDVTRDWFERAITRRYVSDEDAMSGDVELLVEIASLVRGVPVDVLRTLQTQ